MKVCRHTIRLWRYEYDEGVRQRKRARRKAPGGGKKERRKRVGEGTKRREWRR